MLRITLSVESQAALVVPDPLGAFIVHLDYLQLLQTYQALQRLWVRAAGRRTVAQSSIRLGRLSEAVAKLGMPWIASCLSSS